MGRPTVYPTGVTRYNPEKCSNGFTLFPTGQGPVLIDMNGRALHAWGKICSMVVKMLPGGSILGSTENRTDERMLLEQNDLTQLSWDGEVEWRFDNNETVMIDGVAKTTARLHHDFERSGCAAGYYTPNAEPALNNANTLLLSRTNIRASEISRHELLDDRVIEVSWDGQIVWDWKSADHIDEMGFDAAARLAIYRDPTLIGHQPGREPVGDWFHINCVSTLGKNRFYDAGDERFHPDNLIMGSRESNIMIIVSKATGNVVWRVGPDFEDPSLKKLGQIIGQHHVHMIPDGLPGAGNILLFDNGGAAGYGAPDASSPYGGNIKRRHFSRILEFDPVTLDLVWEYSGAVKTPHGENTLFADRFFSMFISSAQRLPNGNTLITEGSSGRIFEVTPDKEIVWEFVNPLSDASRPLNFEKTIYRSFRVPYHWVPQLEQPEEIAVEPPHNDDFRVPGSFAIGDINRVSV